LSISVSSSPSSTASILPFRAGRRSSRALWWLDALRFLLD
jgi:hypothetical protein